MYGTAEAVPLTKQEARRILRRSQKQKQIPFGNDKQGTGMTNKEGE
jgi:hypothetical protein